MEYGGNKGKNKGKLFPSTPFVWEERYSTLPPDFELRIPEKGMLLFRPASLKC